jgi:hypothetical protein
MAKIFFDSDGVAADIDEWIDNNMPSIRGMNDADFWGALSDVPNLFSKFPPLYGFQQVIDACLDAGHDLEWLTATPYPTKYLCTAGNDKRKYLHTYFFPALPVSTISGGKNKAQFLHVYPKSVLIDDYKRNIDMWIEAGGIGILHETRNTQKTLDMLKIHGLI